MFTGIIRQLGTVKKLEKIENKVLLVISSNLGKELQKGDSIAINGVCQTVIAVSQDSFTVELMPETIKLTSLGHLEKGRIVNLERSLRLGESLDGHLVFGHVDGLGELSKIDEDQNAKILTIKFPASLKKYFAHKGSVSLDGISLTVIHPTADQFQVSIVTHTWENTNLKELQVGAKLNLEVDMLARYTLKMLNAE